MVLLESRWNILCVCCFVTDDYVVTRGSTVTEVLNSDGGLIVHALCRVSLEQIMRLLRLHGELIVTMFLQFFNVLRFNEGFSAGSMYL
jgi:hypothetical protein